MKTYTLSDKDRPQTRTQLIDYCSKFYKRAKAIKLIDETVAKHPEMKEEALFCKRVTTFYLNDLLLQMGYYCPEFKEKRKAYEEAVRLEKEEQSKVTERKLLNAIFGDKKT